MLLSFPATATPLWRFPQFAEASIASLIAGIVAAIIFVGGIASDLIASDLQPILQPYRRWVWLTIVVALVVAVAGTFLFETNHPNYFSFASGKYKTVRRNGAIPVSVYLLSDRANMLQYLEGVAKIFDVLVREFGVYRFKEFKLVEVPRELAQKAGFNAGMETGGPQSIRRHHSNRTLLPSNYGG